MWLIPAYPAAAERALSARMPERPRTPGAGPLAAASAMRLTGRTATYCVVVVELVAPVAASLVALVSEVAAPAPVVSVGAGVA